MVADRFVESRRSTWQDIDKKGHLLRRTMGSPRWAARRWTTKRTTSSRSSSPPRARSRSRTKPVFDTPPRFPVWEPPSGAAAPPRSLQDMANADCIVIQGSNMAECHPVGFQWVEEAKARGAKVIHVDPRFTRTSAVCGQAHSDPGRLGRGAARRADQLRDHQRPVVQGVRRRLHQRRDPDQRKLPGHRGSRRFVLRLRPRDRTVRPVDVGLCGARRATSRRRPRARRQRLGPRRGRRARQRRPAAAARPGAARRDPAAPADGVPDPQAALRPLHPGDGARRLRHQPRRTSTTSPAPSPRTPGASAPPASPTPSAGPSTPWARNSSAPQRFCSCCWATSAARAAASWRCAGTPASRAPPTSRRCSTCCPATCRCPRRACTTPSRDYLEAVGSKKQKGFWANADTYIVSLLKAWWGDAARADNDWAYDYLPRLTGPHGTYQTVMAMLDDEVEGYFLLGQNPAVGSANGRMQRHGHVPPEVAGGPRPQPHRVGHLVEGRPRDRLRRAETEDIETEVFFFPAATHVEKAGIVHPDAAAAAVAAQGASTRPATARANCSSSIELGKRIRQRAGRIRPTSATGRCWT